MKKQTSNRILRIVIVGMLAALCFVLSAYVSVKAGSMKFTFAGLPILLAALLFGPVDGMLVGGIGEFLSQIIGYGLTPTTVLWLIPAVVRGLMVGLYAKAKKGAPGIVGTSAMIILSSLVVTLLNGLVIWADAVIMGYYSFAYVFGSTGWRFLASLITAVLYCAVIIPLTAALRKSGVAGLNNIPAQQRKGVE